MQRMNMKKVKEFNTKLLSKILITHPFALERGLRGVLFLDFKETWYKKIPTKKLCLLGNKISFILLFLTYIIIIISCSNDKKSDDKNKSQQNKNQIYIYPSINEKAREAKLFVNGITCDALNLKTKSGQKFYLIDVREIEEYGNGNIPKSVLLPRGIIEFNIGKIIPGITKDNEIILYSFREDRAALAALSLMELGYKNVLYLIGGYEGWTMQPEKSLQIENKSDTTEADTLQDTIIIKFDNK